MLFQSYTTYPQNKTQFISDPQLVNTEFIKRCKKAMDELKVVLNLKEDLNLKNIILGAKSYNIDVFITLFYFYKREFPASVSSE